MRKLYFISFPVIALVSLIVLWTQVPIQDPKTAYKFMAAAASLIVASAGISLVASELVEIVRSALVFSWTVLEKVVILCLSQS